jgi:hypothetical protein
MQHIPAQDDVKGSVSEREMDGIRTQECAAPRHFPRPLDLGAGEVDPDRSSPVRREEPEIPSLPAADFKQALTGTDSREIQQATLRNSQISVGGLPGESWLIRMLEIGPLDFVEPWGVGRRLTFMKWRS